MPTEMLDNLFGLMPANGAQPDAFLSHLLDLSDAGIFAHAFDGQMLMVNAAWEQVLGINRTEIIGRHYLESVGEEAAAHLTARTRRILQTGESQAVVFPLEAASGQRWFRVNLFPVRNPEGEIMVIGGIAAEITEYREAQESLSEAARRAWHLAAVSPAITYIFDLITHRTIYVNRGPQPPAEGSGNGIQTEPVDFLTPAMHPDDLPRFEAHLANLKLAQDDEFQTFEYRVENAQGEWHWYLSRDRVYRRDDDGTPMQVIGCAVDISERKQMEAEKADLLLQAERSNAELKSLIDVLPAAVYIGNTSGIVIANAPGLAMLGFDTVEELNAALPTLAERIAARDPETGVRLPPEEEPFVRALRGEASRRDVLFRNLKTGKDCIVYNAAVPIYEHGEVIAAVVVSTDITESLLLKQEIRRGSEMLKALVAGTSDIIYMKDRDGRFLLVNAPAAVVLGTTVAEAIGKRDADFLTPEDAAMVERNDATVMAGGATVVREEPIVMADGLHVFLSTKDPMRDAEGKVIGLVGFSQDITARKQAEAALQISEARVQVALQAGKLGAWQWNVKTDGLDVSNIFREIYNFDADVPVTLPSYLERIPLEEQSAFRDVLAASFAERRDCETEHRLVLPNGTIRWISVRGRPFYGADSEPTHMIGTSQDITPQRAREAELDALNVRLQRAMQETHHRIKNNLQVISALTDMQITGSDGMVPVEALERIGQHTRTLASLHDLLTAQAAVNAEEDTLQARDVLAKLVPMLQMTSGGRPIRYEAEEVLLSQRQSASFALLVSELISNAIKHGTGLIEVTLGLVPESEPASDAAVLRNVRLEVCDDGAGFPADFDPQKAANTGLELIDSVGRWDLRGSVEFTNREQGGARVVVLFPQEVV